MEITGIVSAVLEAQSGVSQRTGNSWKTQEFVIEIPNGNFTKHACFKLFGEQKIGNAASLLVVGKQVKVSFDIDAREYNGRYFNSLDAWKVEDVNIASNGYAGAVGGVPQTPPTTVAPPTASTIPAPQPNTDGDNLPF